MNSMIKTQVFTNKPQMLIQMYEQGQERYFILIEDLKKLRKQTKTDRVKHLMTVAEFELAEQIKMNRIYDSTITKFYRTSYPSFFLKAELGDKAQTIGEVIG